MKDRSGEHKRVVDDWKVVAGGTRASWKDTVRDCVGREALEGWVGRLVVHTRLVQVHVLGELLLQHVLQLLVHFPKVLIAWLH